MKNDNKKTENQKTGKKGLLFLALIPLVAFLIFIALVLIKKNDKPKAYDLEDETLFVGKVASQDYGKSDAFYKNDTGKKLFVDFGNGYYDFTDFTEGWSFGVPMVDLQKFADTVGLSLTKQVPENYISVGTFDVYSEDDDIDLSKREKWFLRDPASGWYEVVTVTSKRAFDSNGKHVLANAATITDENGAPIVDLSLLPAVRDEKYELGSEMVYEYSGDTIRIKFNSVTNEE